MSADQRLAARLFVQPFAQAVLTAMSAIAASRFLYGHAAPVVFGLNLLWWSNTRLNRQTDHVPRAGLIYASGYTCGYLLGMLIFHLMGVR